MKLLNRLLGRRTDDHNVNGVECKHLQLAPRWNDAEAMGDSSRASAFKCAACGAEFTPDEARELVRAQ